MATFVSSLSPYQFAWNGWLFGAGTQYAVTNVDGLMGLPPIRNQDDIRGYNDGSYSGRDFYDGRKVTIDLIITGNSTYNAQYYYNLLQQNLYPQQLGTPSALGAFQFETSASIGLKVMYGRVRNITTSIDPEFAYGYIQTSVEFFFPDPRYYDYPYTTGSGSSVSLTNNGWAISCPVITVSSAPSLFTISDGTISMTFAPTSGTTVVIDLLQKTITQNGVPNRSILSTSNGWLSLAPMSSATWTTTAGSLSISYTDAYV
jgi:hypothetical protein